MKLRELLSEIPHRLISGEEETEITSIVYDSRKVKPGSLFVCLTGFLTDGHEYIRQALEQGAVAVMAEREVEPGAFPVTKEEKPGAFPVIKEEKPGEEPAGGVAAVIQVPDTREALAYLAAAWFGHPARELCIIGITGTKGKTTTAHMLRSILEEQGEQAGMIGTLGAYIGREHIPTDNTTPEPWELHRLFARMRQKGCRYVVMEVSSQALKQKRTAGILFAYGVFLNISPDHIGAGEHEDFAEYLACKGLLFSQTKQAVASIDDMHWQDVTGAMERVVTVSTQKRADYQGTAIRNCWKPGFLGVEFQVTEKGAPKGKLRLNMPGQFNVENALAAIAVASGLGISWEVMAAALGKVYVKGRTQLLKGTAHFSTFLIDYAHNALSMENLLETLRGYHPGRLVCMFGGGGNKPKQRRYDMGRIAGKYADLSIITMDNPRFEDMEEINKDIIAGLKVHDGAYKVISDRKQAIHYLIDNSGREDLVVFVGKGHETYQEIRGKRYYFSEEEIVEGYLQTK
ncbi:MAG: UDP-N-acetylmuramoyl-L-alanyl-D-glutamate--2,6-diaminopimelate ligase [Lachnospiraceae bacterium]|nr:UDP-N-acetylmuramoyl-L-alanyl-D-glutamate--2,6-diaminopimelate ligase [Lachnospiraceae bacterium]